MKRQQKTEEKSNHLHRGDHDQSKRDELKTKTISAVAAMANYNKKNETICTVTTIMAESRRDEVKTYTAADVANFMAKSNK